VCPTDLPAAQRLISKVLFPFGLRALRCRCAGEGFRRKAPARWRTLPGLLRHNAQRGPSRNLDIPCLRMLGATSYLSTGLSLTGQTAPQAVPSEEIVAQRWAELSRWGGQWLNGFSIAFFAAMLLSTVLTVPPWFAKDSYEPRGMLTAFAIGIVWASADYIWRKARAKPEPAVASD
jgi:hypothetical protein